MGKWAVGVDLGGTKIAVASISDQGEVLKRIRVPTDVTGGTEAIQEQIRQAAFSLIEGTDSPPEGIGVGVAAQIEPEQGVILNAPNLHWTDVPFQENLKTLTKLPVRIVNDVKAAALGEWRFGAGTEATDLICVFVGTGIGGGIIANGSMLEGCTNTAGEVGHIVIREHGLKCHCGSIGCLESYAGGWAIAERARDAAKHDPDAAQQLIDLAGGIDRIDARHLAEGFRLGDLLSKHLVHETALALGDGCVSLVNAFNPCRLILGGGVIEGLPELIPLVEKHIHEKALRAATGRLSLLKAALGNEAGVVGAATLFFE